MECTKNGCTNFQMVHERDFPVWEYWLKYRSGGNFWGDEGCEREQYYADGECHDYHYDACKDCPSDYNCYIPAGCHVACGGPCPTGLYCDFNDNCVEKCAGGCDACSTCEEVDSENRIWQCVSQCSAEEEYCDVGGSDMCEPIVPCYGDCPLNHECDQISNVCVPTDACGGSCSGGQVCVEWGGGLGGGSFGCYDPGYTLCDPYAPCAAGSGTYCYDYYGLYGCYADYCRGTCTAPASECVVWDFGWDSACYAPKTFTKCGEYAPCTGGDRCYLGRYGLNGCYSSRCGDCSAGESCFIWGGGYGCYSDTFLNCNPYQPCPASSACLPGGGCAASDPCGGCYELMGPGWECIPITIPAPRGPRVYSCFPDAYEECYPSYPCYNPIEYCQLPVLPPFIPYCMEMITEDRRSSEDNFEEYFE